MGMQCMSDQQSIVAGHYEEGETPVETPAQTPVERGLGTRSHNAEIQSITQPRANVCVPMQSKLKVCTNAWLDRSINTKNYVSS